MALVNRRIRIKSGEGIGKRKPDDDIPIAYVVGQKSFDNNQRLLPQSHPNMIEACDVKLCRDKKSLKRDKKMRTFYVEVPEGVFEGEEFMFFTRGNTAVKVIAPLDSCPGQSLVVNIPKSIFSRDDSSTVTTSSLSTISDVSRSQVQVFDVTAPKGFNIGESFVIIAGGLPFLIESPFEKRVQIHLPSKIFHGRADCRKRNSHSEGFRELPHIAEIPYGWRRVARIPDLSQVWVRTDKLGIVLDSQNPSRYDNFDIDTAAFIRCISIKNPSSSDMLEGLIKLEYANRSSSSMLVKHRQPQTISKVDFVLVSSLNFRQKCLWFRDRCCKMRLDVKGGPLHMDIRRKFLITDSLNAVMSFTRNDLLKKWYIHFTGEENRDSEVSTKEWFNEVCEEMLHPDNGLFEPCKSDGNVIQINPASEQVFPDSHLIYYRALGRILGKALSEQRYVPNRMSHYLYKMILGWPVTLEDLMGLDKICHSFLISVRDANEKELNKMNLTFVALKQNYSDNGHDTIELVKGGQKIKVNSKNKDRFLELSLKFYLLSETEPQMKELLLGIYDVIPESLLSIFDEEELQSLLCGGPTINVMKWKRYTVYSGKFQKQRESHQVCKWFWEIVEFFDEAMRARLLQFVTGNSSLQGTGMEGNLFEIRGVSFDDTFYPRVNKSKNLLELPLYESKDMLLETLLPSIEVGEGMYNGI